MEIHIISLFPESIRPYLDASIMQQAQKKGLFRHYIHNLSDWSVKNTRRVDDRPYGGGPGTIITIEPLTNCIRDIEKKFGEMKKFLMSPKGQVLQQNFLETYIQHQKILIICGHYEGVDARIFELFSIEEISIGEYVLSSGEISALVLIDGLVRLIPGVLSPKSLEEESFSKKLGRKREYPQFSRPENFEGFGVPPVLLSGNPKNINEWKKNSLT